MFRKQQEELTSVRLWSMSLDSDDLPSEQSSIFASFNALNSLEAEHGSVVDGHYPMSRGRLDRSGSPRGYSSLRCATLTSWDQSRAIATVMQGAR